MPASDEVVLDDSHYRLERLDAATYCLTRSAARFETLAELHEVHDRLIAQLRTISERAPVDLIVDLRQVRGRNDPEFETNMSGYRRQMFGLCRRVAAVLASAVGRLQVGRHLREDGIDHEAFADIPEARAWLEQRRSDRT